VTGVFVDAPVANLGYRTATLSGRTGTNGTFQYRPGETVIFSIGGIDAPPIAGADVVSPNALSSETAAVNFARLLQTLDLDGNPANGIVIPDAAHTAAAGMHSVSYDAVGFDSAVEHLVTTVQGEGATLVTAAEATAHVDEQLRAGAWVGGPSADPTIIVLFADGSYAEVEGATGNPDGPGFELGTYTFDPASHDFAGQVGTLDTNGSPALPTLAPGPARAWFYDSQAIFDPGNGTTVAFARAHDAANPIVGAWVTRTGNDRIVVTYLANGKYVMGHGGTADPINHGLPGVEYGTYTWNASTGAWTALSGSPDTNGTWGFSDPYSNGHETARAIVTISGSDMVAFDPTSNVTMTWTRVGF
jgi:hypothetical protein